MTEKENGRKGGINKMGKIKFYSLKKIMQIPALYYVIFGGRSNGKTYAVQEYAIKRYYEKGEQTAIIRRWQDDFTGKRGQTMFDNQASNGNIAKITNGEWEGIYYFASKWYLCRYDGDDIIKDPRPFAYGFAISAQEHDKSTAYPGITTILFDEFLTRSYYLPDEFVLFMNCLSTIIRHRTDVKIFMLGNTVNKYCPYFTEMGLSHVKQMKPGTIDVYHYGNENLVVAVEYTDNHTSTESAAYFAFDNPKLSMITGNAWEIDIYPHCPEKYKPQDILFTYFIDFNGELLQCEIVQTDTNYFTFIHRKTTPIKNPGHDCIYTPDYHPGPNYHRKITKPTTQLEAKIAEFYKKDKIFYQDNEVGEIVRNYLMFCRSVEK